MLKKFTCTDVTNGQHLLLQTEYIVSVVEHHENGVFKHSEIRMKTNLLYRVKETVLDVEKLVNSQQK